TTLRRGTGSGRSSTTSAGRATSRETSPRLLPTSRTRWPRGQKRKRSRSRASSLAAPLPEPYWRSVGAGRPLPSWSERCGSAEAENELRVVRHAVGRPRRVERQLALDRADAGDLVQHPLDVLLDH